MSNYIQNELSQFAFFSAFSYYSAKKIKKNVCSTNYIMLLKLFTFSKLLHNFVRCDRIEKKLIL